MLVSLHGAASAGQHLVQPTKVLQLLYQVTTTDKLCSKTVGKRLLRSSPGGGAATNVQHHVCRLQPGKVVGKISECDNYILHSRDNPTHPSVDVELWQRSEPVTAR